MAAPMRETPVANPPTTANFEYDDNEWDIGIGDLIIDLDADIEKTGVGEGMAAPKPGKMHSPVEHQATVDKGLKMKIKRTKPGTKHEIVKSGENGEKHPNSGSGGSSAKRGSSGHRREKKHAEKPGQKELNGLVRSVERVVFPVGGAGGLKDKRPTGGSSVSQPQEEPPQPPAKKLKAVVGPATSQPAPPQLLPPTLQPHSPPPLLEPTDLKEKEVAGTRPDADILARPIPGSTRPPSNAGIIADKSAPQSVRDVQLAVSINDRPSDVVDVCVGTSIGTITEPDCLGPCEPGTSVTLEGIVWHETEGVLVVNVTWRGKTYVGTLLDCTRHDWAPPRFCDSPTSDIDTRTPKGRGKRGRNSSNATISDLSNFTETRSSVHSKLRSNNSTGPKGKKGPGSASPTPFAAPKPDSTPGKRKAKTQEEESAKRKPAPPPQPASPLALPVLLECPEPNCSKKYKHINGLKYHQSHAHGSPDDEEAKESGMSEEEEQSPMPEIKKDEIGPEFAPRLDDETLHELIEKTKLEEGPAPRNMSTVAEPLLLSPLPSPPVVEPPVATTPVAKVPQFKVKPASALMPDEKKPVLSPVSTTVKKHEPHKKKTRKSPAGSPHPSPLEPPPLGIETGRDDVQSPAYSDISDDAAPLLESEVEGKPKQNVGDKKESGQSPQLQHYGMYPYYGQPPYLVPSVPEKPKETPPDKIEGKPPDKEKKEGNGEYHQKLIQHGYIPIQQYYPGYPYNMDGYPVVIDEKKEDKVPPPAENKQPPAQLHIPNPSKAKSESTGIVKDKHQNENHQILKESIEMKSQMNPSFLYQRQQNQEDMRRYYIYSERKEGATTKATPPPQKALPTPSPKHKEKTEEKKERREEDKKQEGVKPTMETQGPPPPPTSQYAYIHPGYMQSPHYGLPFDPSHPMYRGMNPMLVSGYTNSPYLHPQLHAVPRYHAPEDLSRPQSGKALDLLQHHASQYYPHPTHKIHELQERAIKSPTPKTSTASAASPSASVAPVVPVTTTPSVQVQGKPATVDTKDTRSPPPQRHVHTHHHTHVGLGYPILAGQYPAPYGAAVLASEHAAAVTSVPYQAK